jgi:uncharacterized membrane protein YbhN (UPF0104 family)
MRQAKELLVRWFSVHHLDRSAKQIMALILLSAAFYAAAGVGMAYAAGFSAVQQRLATARWWWLAPAVGAVAAGFFGYYLGYRGISEAEEGPQLGRSAWLAVVTAGFGGFLAHGGTAVDEFAMQAGGAGERETKVRVSALGGFEQGVLALIVCPAAIVAVALGTSSPRPGYAWPWAVIPPLGFCLAMWLAERYRDRLRGRKGWRGHVGVFLDSIHVILGIMRRPHGCGFAFVGMGLFWAADMFAVWASTAAFGLHMSVLTLIVCFGTGMIFTRRTGPLGGVGIILAALAATFWNGGGVPLAAATLGVALYNLLVFWIPLPGAILALPKLRALQAQAEKANGAAQLEKGQPALAP